MNAHDYVSVCGPGLGVDGGWLGVWISLGVTVSTHMCVCGGVGPPNSMPVCLGHGVALSEIIWLQLHYALDMFVSPELHEVSGRVTSSVSDHLIVHAP